MKSNPLQKKPKEDPSGPNHKEQQGIQKRKDKHAPMEMSSRNPVSRKRRIVQPAKKPSRDPRFDPLCGQFNPELFKRSYGGTLQEQQSKELKMLQVSLKKTKDLDEADKIKRTLESMV
jgi:ribosomal RNA-processing protein 36